MTMQHDPRTRTVARETASHTQHMKDIGTPPQQAAIRVGAAQHTIHGRNSGATRRAPWPQCTPDSSPIPSPHVSKSSEAPNPAQRFTVRTTRPSIRIQQHAGPSTVGPIITPLNLPQCSYNQPTQQTRGKCKPAIKVVPQRLKKT